MINEKIETSRLLLRKPIENDYHDVYSKWASDPDVVKYLTWAIHKSNETTKEFIDWCILQWDKKQRLPFIICLKDSNEIIGMIDFRIKEFKADFGYVLAKQYWNQGFMTEALTKLIDEVLSVNSIYRVWAVCDIANKGSARVMEKSGMVYEGVLKRWTIHPNVSSEPRDCFVYSKAK